MEQILTSANNRVDAVFAANDGLANSAINAMEAAGIENAPVSGQDATAAGIQNILLGKQTMTVYKPIQSEAEVAANVALALRDGEDIESVEVPDVEFDLIGIQTEDGNPTEEPEGDGVVPYFALTPIGVTEENIAETVIEDGFRTVREVCTGDTAQTPFCRERS
jgi:D-xylose transport system substrate-binding protein